MKQSERISYALDAMQKLDFPSDSIGYFRRIGTSWFLTGSYADRLAAMTDDYMAKRLSCHDVIEALKPIASEIGVPFYSMVQLFYYNCMADLREVYAEKGYTDEMLNGVWIDLRCKLLECREVDGGIWGNSTGGWSDGFFKLTRFALGRFQYEYAKYDYTDTFTVSGMTLKRGDPVIKFHIPSCGPFPRALRYDSYRRAYEFFRDYQRDGVLPIVCDSWLLFPDHDIFLPETSNIRDFLHDFTIASSGHDDNIRAPWRAFGRYFREPFDKLPRDTGLRRAYADWLVSGHATGWGCGVLLFDGEKILNSDRT